MQNQSISIFAAVCGCVFVDDADGDQLAFSPRGLLATEV
jgi:hypothetical protein